MQPKLILGSLLAASTTLAATSPPACLLAALGAQGGNPSDTKSLCQDLQDTMLDDLTRKCDDGSSLSDAYDQFAAVCSDIGIKVNKLPTDEPETDSSSKKKKKKGGSGGDETETATSSAATATSTSDDDDSGAFTHDPSIFYLVTGISASILAGTLLL